MAKITFLVENKCALSAVAGSIDAFAIANLWWCFLKRDATEPLFETEIVTLDGAPVVVTGGIELKPDQSVAEVQTTDLLVCPMFIPPLELKTKRMNQIINWLREVYERGIRIAAPCTGTFILAESGLLDGRMATTNWYLAGMFRRQYPKVDLRIDRILTEDSGLICCGATTAFMNLCLHLMEQYGSPELAALGAKALLIDPERREQTPYMMFDFWKQHADDLILKAQTWMEENYAQKLSIDEIAKKIGMSERNFKRRFKEATGEPPLTYLQRLRIEKAKRRLELSKDNINEITWQVGYEDINSFRKLFIKHTGMSPSKYRTKFSWRTQI